MANRKLSTNLRRPVTKSITVKSTSTYLTPSVYVSEIPVVTRSIAAAPTAVALFIGRSATGSPLVPQTCTSLAEYIRHFGIGGPADTLEQGIRLFFLNGGTRCLVVKINHPAGTDYAAAFSAVESAQLRFNLLVLAPDATVAIDAHYPAASEFCRQHHAFLLMDPPARWTRAALALAEIKIGFTGIAADYAAIFYPPLRLNDGREIGAAAALAGVFARTDQSRGVWKAPAGLDATISGIAGFASDLTDAEIDRLNVAGINPLRTHNGLRLVWGSRTWANLGEYRYIPVRRLASHVQTSLTDGLAWVSLESNGPALWASIRQTTESFLDSLFHQGAFQGASPRDAYFVRCDRSTMTATDQAAGRVIVQVGFAPLKPAEFVVFRLALTTVAP